MSVYDIAVKYSNQIKAVEYPKHPSKPVKRNGETHTEFGVRMDQYESDIKQWNVLHNEYHQAVGRIEDSFRQALFVELGIENHPKRDKFYAKAWDRGHSGGLNEVASELEDLVELM